MRYSDIIDKGDPDRIKTGPDPDMMELVKSQTFAELWGKLKDSYDMVIVDAPGIIKDVYAPNVLERVDMIVYLISAQHTKRAEIASGFHELERDKLRPCGILLNQVPRIYIDDARIHREYREMRKKRGRVQETKPKQKATTLKKDSTKAQRSQ